MAEAAAAESQPLCNSNNDSSSMIILYDCIVCCSARLPSALMCHSDCCQLIVRLRCRCRCTPLTIHHRRIRRRSWRRRQCRRVAVRTGSAE